MPLLSAAGQGNAEVVKVLLADPRVNPDTLNQENVSQYETGKWLLIIFCKGKSILHCCT